MKLTEEMGNVIQKSPYLTLVTILADGTPHPIIAGGKEQTEDGIAIGIYKMECTQKNLAADPRAWIAVATVSDGPKGFRFAGTATVSGGKVLFVPETAEAMI